ncbi:anti-sigma factor antagonist [Leptospira idonii]|uniref:Anti-sigma factor antagonist n=1 Tax=Leptospira idonii TaxID=1193500 RepID=A0A4R9M2N6_9LEPT|nr:anti-sigma factor antagonist [Leptospira idonii]TGN20382.1 STAS domain-containing protein [Leptospira idonii]
MSENWQEYTIESGEFKMEVVAKPSVILPHTAIVFALSGEINLYNSQAIKENLELLIGKGLLHFFLNVEDVSYIDSSGLGVCLGIHSRLSKNSGFIRLVSPSEKVRYVLELTKLKSLLQIFPSLEEASQSF